MQLIKATPEWQKIRKQLPLKSIGFVPTMGCLHAGHQSLLERARQENEISVLSIFVNPTQFNNAEDLAKYPVTLEQDLALAENAAVDYVLMPSYAELYPDHYHYRVSEDKLSKLMEGYFRPGHFDGVLTVVLKLLNWVQPTRAYFGKKDYQQYLLIKGMVEAFLLDIEIIPCDTIRAETKLALSSRNQRLTPEQQQQAALLAHELSQTYSLEIIREKLKQHGFEVEYIEEYAGRRFAAAWFHGVRLIDNVEVASCSFQL